MCSQRGNVKVSIHDGLISERDSFGYAELTTANRDALPDAVPLDKTRAILHRAWFAIRLTPLEYVEKE